jgi:glycine oxidase
MEDVIIVGGGVIGLSIAVELAGQGVSVAIVEQGDFGREASWAGAGILPPGNAKAARTPEALLRGFSHSLWPDWAESLEAESGMEIGYARCGGLELRLGRATGELADEIRTWRDEEVRVEELSPDDARQLEPRLAPEIGAVYHLPDLAQVRNPRLLKALLAVCGERGVRLLPGTPVVGFDERDGQIAALRTPNGLLRAGRYCVAGGAWSRSLLESLGTRIAVEPVRGQIALVSQMPRLFTHVLQVGPRYLVPRADGRILIGATEEHVGFLKANTASAVRDLLALGTSLVPELAGVSFERAWSGLRPGSADGLPYLGVVGGYQNLFIAAGHFRSGLQMSPGTARLMRQTLLDQETEFDLEPFSCERRQGVASQRSEGTAVSEGVSPTGSKP